MERLDTTDLPSYIPGYDQYIGADKEEQKCSNCENTKNLFDYESVIYCWDCLLITLKKEKILTTSHKEQFFTNGDYVCDDDEIDLLEEDLRYNYDIKKVGEE